MHREDKVVFVTLYVSIFRNVKIGNLYEIMIYKSIDTDFRFIFLLKFAKTGRISEKLILKYKIKILEK